MTKNINIIVFLLLSLLAAPHWIQAQEVGDKFKSGKLYYRITSTTPSEVEVAPQNDDHPKWSEDEVPTGAVVIPSTVEHQDKTYAVTSIGEEVFWECKSLASITIPKTVASIGEAAFGKCITLTSIEVDTENPEYSSQDGVLFNKNKSTLIQYPCGKTGEYSIPNSVTSIEDFAFAYSSGLTAVTIPNSVTSIGENAFSDCSKLETIISYIENVGTVSLGYEVFFNVPVATCKLFVPDGKVNDYKAAEQWKDFKYILPLSTKGQIGEGDKFKSGKLYYRVTSTAPAEVEVAPQNDDYPKWSEDEAPTGAVEIPAEVVHQDKTYAVTSIGESAFEMCSELTSIEIPNSVTSIGNSAFSDCSKLETIISYIENVGTVSLGYGVFLVASVATCKLFVPDGKVNDYRAAERWKEFKYIRPLSTKGQIGEGDKFKSGKLYYRITSTTPTEVEVAPQNDNYSKWNEDEAPTGAVVIPSTVVHQDKTYAVTSIGKFAFYECSELTSIEIPNSVTSIGYFAFYDCSKLDTIISYIENVGAVRLGDNVFFMVPVATCKLFVPDGKVNDYKVAKQWKEFKYIHPLSTKGQIGEGDKFKSGKLYYRVTSTAPAEVEVAPQNDNYPKWSEDEAPTGAVVIPSTVVHQDKTYAVTSIRSSAFEMCSELTSIEIPNSVTSIGYFAFYDCSKLDTIISYIENVGAVRLGDNVFFMVPVATCKLFVPDGKVNDYKVAKQWKEFKNITATVPAPPAPTPAPDPDLDPDSPSTPDSTTTAVALASEPLRMHPNPTVGGINLEAQGEVRVFNSLGQLVLAVKADGPTRIELGHLPAGIYIVRTGAKVAKVLKR